MSQTKQGRSWEKCLLMHSYTETKRTTQSPLKMSLHHGKDKKKSNLQDKSNQVWYFLLAWDVLLPFQKDWEGPPRGLSLTLCFWAHDWWLMIMWPSCCWYLGKALWLQQLDLQGPLWPDESPRWPSLRTELNGSLVLPLIPVCNIMVHFSRWSPRGWSIRCTWAHTTR